MTQQNNPTELPVSSEGGITVDYKRVIYHAIRYWYWIVLSLAVALTIAFLKNRYSQRIYPVSASIIIREAGDGNNAQILANAIGATYKNYLNELYIIRSYPLIEDVMRDLNFGVQFFREGDIITSELYDLPMGASLLNQDEVGGVNCGFKVMNANEYQLGEFNDGELQSPKTFYFNDTIEYQGARLVFIVKDAQALKALENQSLIFAYSSPAALSIGYANRLVASWAEEGAGVVNLSVSGPNPLKDVDFLNGVINRYQRYDLERKNASATRIIDFITAQLDDITDSLTQVENVLQRFKGKTKVQDLGTEASRLFQKLEGIESQKAEMIIRQNYNKYLLDYIRTNQNLDQVILPTSVGINDPVLTSFLTQMVNLQLEMKMVLNKERLDNPVLKTQRQRLQEIKNSIVESIKNQQSTDRIRETSINKQISNVERELAKLPASEREQVAIQRNYSLLENLYLILLQKRAEAGISRASNISDVEIVNPPMAGGSIAPTPQRNYILATAIGLALPFILFALLEILNTRVQSKEDIEKITSIPFIGGVGHKTTEDNKSVINSPKSAVAESFRALRSNLNYFLGNREKAVILVTSSISGEGKTFTTINLATVFAFAGKKTLIVGADLRKPKLFGDFNLSNELGLSTYLAGLNSFDQIVQKTDAQNLFLVSGGPVPPNPSELILSAKMQEFFELAKKEFDYIIVDSPPMAIVADAFVLSPFCDHLLFLVRQNYTPKNLLQSVNDYYHSGRLKNISIVLNDIYRSGPGYGYGYTYGYGYGYGYTYGAKGASKGYYTE